MKSDEQERVRQQVRATYTEAVTKKSCCCGSRSSGGEEVQGGVAGKANYDPAALVDLPRDAVENSFGCGDPVAFAGVEAGQTVLDLGSGAGIDLLLAARKVGPAGRVLGVDMTDAMIARARANVAAAGLGNVEIRQGVIEELPVEDAEVDWVISNCVINLSPDKPRVFGEIARVLRSGGQLAVSDMVAAELPAEIRASSALHGACVAGAIGEEEYLAGLRAAGLVDVEVRGRLVYGEDEIRAFLSSDECPTGGEVLSDEQVERFTRLLTGKVWSARFHARKP